MRLVSSLRATAPAAAPLRAEAGFEGRPGFSLWRVLRRRWNMAMRPFWRR